MAATSALRHARKSPLRGSFSKSRTQRKEYTTWTEIPNKACETKHNVRNCCWHIWLNDGSKVFYATDMGNLNGITAPYYDLYLVEANYRDEEIQAKIAEKKVNGEYIYEKRVLRDHMSEQDAIDWVYGNMRPDSTYVWLHCHKEESK